MADVGVGWLQVPEQAVVDGTLQNGDIRLERGQRRAQGETGEPDVRKSRIRGRRRRRGTESNVLVVHMNVYFSSVVCLYWRPQATTVVDNDGRAQARAVMRPDLFADNSAI